MKLMKRVGRFLKRAANAYFDAMAKNYDCCRYTGNTWINPRNF